MMREQTLERYLCQVRDPRRSQGQRSSLTQLFAMIVISNLCGHLGGRAIARFTRANESSFTKELELKYPPPSHVTFSDFINRVDHQTLIKVFNQWTKDTIALPKGSRISGDGKALGSTVKHVCTSSQDFQAIVSLFCQESGLVYALDTYRNQKESEIGVIRFLITELENRGMNIFLDALHCQKKRSPKSSLQAMTTRFK